MSLEHLNFVSERTLTTAVATWSRACTSRCLWSGKLAAVSPVGEKQGHWPWEQMSTKNSRFTLGHERVFKVLTRSLLLSGFPSSQITESWPSELHSPFGPSWIGTEENMKNVNTRLKEGRHCLTTHLNVVLTHTHTHTLKINIILKLIMWRNYDDCLYMNRLIYNSAKTYIWRRGILDGLSSV